MWQKVLNLRIFDSFIYFYFIPYRHSYIANSKQWIFLYILCYIEKKIVITKSGGHSRFQNILKLSMFPCLKRRQAFIKRSGEHLSVPKRDLPAWAKGALAFPWARAQSHRCSKSHPRNIVPWIHPGCIICLPKSRIRAVTSTQRGSRRRCRGRKRRNILAPRLRSTIGKTIPDKEDK